MGKCQKRVMLVQGFREAQEIKYIFQNDVIDVVSFVIEGTDIEERQPNHLNRVEAIGLLFVLSDPL